MKLRKLVIASFVLSLALPSAASAGDPFDDARYYVTGKQNAEALKIIDSGDIDVNMQTDEGYSLLHYAADANNLEMVKALLERGADPTLKTKRGSTPYDMAMGSTIKLVLAKARAGNAPASSEAAAVPTRKASGNGPSNGMCDAARKDPAASGRSPALRPLLAARDAIWYNHPEELAALLDDCVSVDAKDSGTTLLHIAAERDRVDAAKILLEGGASRSARDPDGKTPAAYAQSPEMRALLGPAPAAAATKTSSSGTASAGRKKECEQKYQADAALSSDATGKARSYRRWQQCLKTGLYW
jgi:ankyrin repeat protein